MPGQFGPTSLVLFCVLSMFVTRTISCCGIPSVMQTCNVAQYLAPLDHLQRTTSGISAATASSMPAAAKLGGINKSEALQDVFFMASATFANTGRSRCVLPAFLGFVPPTMFVLLSCQHRPSIRGRTC